MGQKVNPIGLRVGINRTWDSRWYAKDDYAKLLHEDVRIREYLEKQLEQAGISKIVIERPAKKARVTIYSARPGVIIGKKGADIDKLRAAIAKMTNSARKGSGSIVPAVWAAQKLRGRNGIAKAGCHCTRCVPTSITGRLRL